MSRLQHRQLARTALAAEQDFGHAGFSVTWLKRNAETISNRVNCDIDDAPRGISYEPHARTSGPSTPTEAKALQRGDQIAAQALEMLAQLREARRFARLARLAAQRAEQLGSNLLAMDAKRADELARTEEVKADPEDETRSTVCANRHCQRIVSRTPNDRLRGGRCNACRMYLDRNGMERPRHLCAIDEDATGMEALGLDPERLIVEGEVA